MSRYSNHSRTKARLHNYLSAPSAPPKVNLKPRCRSSVKTYRILGEEPVPREHEECLSGQSVIGGTRLEIRAERSQFIEGAHLRRDL